MWVQSHLAKGFCQVEKIPKIREKLGSGWVGEAPSRILIFFFECFILFVFCVVFMFQKKIKKDRGWLGGV